MKNNIEFKYQDKLYNTMNKKSEEYLSKKEEKITQMIQARNIEFSGIFGYDESFFTINGEKISSHNQY